jgi:hypothetical protein
MGNACLTINTNGGGNIMFNRKTALVWVGILVLSGAFLMGQESWGPCVDNDGDGYGATSSAACPNSGLDCNDSDPLIHPGTFDIPGNGIDEDCNGSDAVPTGDPDLDLLVDFLTDDLSLMQAFLIEDPTPGPGTDVTIDGAISGSCRWRIYSPSVGHVMNSYDYQAYNESGLIMSGLRSGEMNIIGYWIVMGTLEFSGTWNGWIFDFMPMNGMFGPILGARTWNVCNYDNGCTNPPGNLTGVPIFTEDDLP